MNWEIIVAVVVLALSVWVARKIKKSIVLLLLLGVAAAAVYYYAPHLTDILH